MNFQDLQQIDELLQKRLDEKLKNVTTKDDLKATEKRLTDTIEREASDLAEIITSFAEHLDEKKANKNIHN